jgi:hypothetical protein
VTIKAIETRYRGCKFRSRLEARWGVFLDAVGIRWEYEREGYHLPSGDYLPDFWLTVPWWRDGHQHCWLEVKGEHPTDPEIALVVELADHTNCRGIIVHGGHNLDQNGMFWDCLLAHPGRGCAYACSLEECLPMLMLDEAKYLAAFRAARSARFEHGENPCP